ncbi:MAG: TonB-dependent receptor [Bacteroidales bacterium]|nr:TonB-dependent receptor [Bacteroidales bacterium]
MRRIYITIAALAFSAGMLAQTQDSLLRRQMELERDFNPTLMDANKITSLPTLREPTVQKANTNYSTWAGRATPPLEIALPRPGDIMTSIPFSTHKGYLTLHAGNYANFDGALGYRILDEKKHQLGFTFLHNSTNGDINYVQEDANPAGNKARVMNNNGRLAYRHTADAFALDMHLAYLHSLFNYYGNGFGEERYYNDENQRLGVTNVHVALQSTPSDALNFNGFLDFKNFSSKYGETLSMEGIKGNQIHALAGFAKPFQEGNSRIGVDGSILTTLYPGDLDNYFHVNAAPFILFSGLNWSARLGVDAVFQSIDGTRIRVVPNADVRWGITDHSSLYSKVHGGYNPNTFLDMMEESRYVLPFINVRPSFTHVDLEAGVKIGEVSGFRFDFFGGFRKTDHEHFLLLNGHDAINGEEPGPFIEALKPVYGHLSHSFVGGMLQTNVWAPLDVSLRLKKNFYDVTNLSINETDIADTKAYNKPGMEVDLRAALEMIENLKLTLGYYYAGDRWTNFNGTDIEMDAINDLNAGAIYTINDTFSLNVKVNNLLAQRYDIWYGYPAQGINASGGFTFTF